MKYILTALYNLIYMVHPIARIGNQTSLLPLIINDQTV